MPLSTWLAPAHRQEALFTEPSVRDSVRRLGFTPTWVVGDLAYVGLATARRLREELGVALVTKLRPDMKWQPPFDAHGQARCAQGQPLTWQHYEAESQTQWFAPTPPGTLCSWCWARSSCPREFGFAAADHEILFGQVPHNSWLARHLLDHTRAWVEPAQSFEKNQLGLRHLFLNSLALTWTMGLLADTVVWLRATAQLQVPPAAPSPLLQHLVPQQAQFPW